MFTFLSFLSLSHLLSLMCLFDMSVCLCVCVHAEIYVWRSRTTLASMFSSSIVLRRLLSCLCHTASYRLTHEFQDISPASFSLRLTAGMPVLDY